MGLSSNNFSGWFRLKGQSRSNLYIIVPTKSVFLNPDLGGVLQPGSPTPRVRPCRPPFLDNSSFMLYDAEYGALVRWQWKVNNEILREQSVPVPYLTRTQQEMKLDLNGTASHEWDKSILGYNGCQARQATGWAIAILFPVATEYISLRHPSKTHSGGQLGTPSAGTV